MQDGAFVLYLKMAHTPHKVLDDHMRMHVHGFSFQRGRLLKNFWKFTKGEIKKGQVSRMSYKVIQKCSVLNSAPRLR